MKKGEQKRKATKINKNKNRKIILINCAMQKTKGYYL